MLLLLYVTVPLNSSATFCVLPRYENIVHIPYRFKKACEGMPEPEADFNELMPSNKGLLEHLDDEERCAAQCNACFAAPPLCLTGPLPKQHYVLLASRILMEMDLLGRKAYPKPQSRLEKYKLQLIEEARAESKEKRMKVRRCAVLASRRERQKE